MGLKWIDSRELAIELSEQHPDVDPVTLRFTDLREWILALEAFDDDPEHCSERVLEAVQMYWIEEAD
ncbi:Fe-S cluster assembly protein IscX [Photobacterium sp. DNB23_23_1]|uniref:Fe-S cluster assembly protein IscX n=1 Tax=Photobacterium pectinilyticum TaxID=2906793 RepID=A0ABT1MZH0_9GAMM|nr:Fe-S cluster assembly protein IscX [Photobacterium sp. ZSDE20]MCQ1057029.1 Fe-S cluster assembly protein IscX [Photobacterium sp. ZSDE20]MDD1821164.1 Fe-S cluster assembly protein IscX [Photobacterium sp. ZSDE20]